MRNLWLAILEKEWWKSPRPRGDCIFLELGNEDVIPEHAFKPTTQRVFTHADIFEEGSTPGEIAFRTCQSNFEGLPTS